MTTTIKATPKVQPRASERTQWIVCRRCCRPFKRIGARRCSCWSESGSLSYNRKDLSATEAERSNRFLRGDHRQDSDTSGHNRRENQI